MCFGTLEKSGSDKEDLGVTVCWDFQEAFPQGKVIFREEKLLNCTVACQRMLWMPRFVGYRTDQVWEYRGINPSLENPWPHFSGEESVLEKYWYIFTSSLYLPLLNAGRNWIACLFSNPECSCKGAAVHMEISRKYDHWNFQMACLLCLIDELW